MIITDDISLDSLSAARSAALALFLGFVFLGLVLSLIKLNSTACCLFPLRIWHLLLELSCLLFYHQLLFCLNLECYVFEHSIDVLSCFGTRLIKLHAMLGGQGLTFGQLDLGVWQITLIRHQYTHDVSVRILLYLI